MMEFALKINKANHEEMNCPYEKQYHKNFKVSKTFDTLQKHAIPH
jgi:hypothetical protein